MIQRTGDFTMPTAGAFVVINHYFRHLYISTASNKVSLGQLKSNGSSTFKAPKDTWPTAQGAKPRDLFSPYALCLMPFA
jgi:hypothetical protein